MVKLELELDKMVTKAVLSILVRLWRIQSTKAPPALIMKRYQLLFKTKARSTFTPPDLPILSDLT